MRRISSYFRTFEKFNDLLVGLCFDGSQKFDNEQIVQLLHQFHFLAEFIFVEEKWSLESSWDVSELAQVDGSVSSALQWLRIDVIM